MATIFWSIKTLNRTLQIRNGNWCGMEVRADGCWRWMRRRRWAWKTKWTMNWSVWCWVTCCKLWTWRTSKSNTSEMFMCPTADTPTRLDRRWADSTWSSMTGLCPTKTPLTTRRFLVAESIFFWLNRMPRGLDPAYSKTKSFAQTTNHRPFTYDGDGAVIGKLTHFGLASNK